MHKDPGIEAEVAKVRQGELVTSACAGSTRQEFWIPAASEVLAVSRQ